VSRYRPGEQAFVRLQLRGPDGMISLTRQGTSISNILTVVDSDGRHDGDAAEDHLATGCEPEGGPASSTSSIEASSSKRH